MKPRNGFTLIELLVVIAVIAILSAILFPVYVSAKSGARKSTCSSNLRQLAVASINYADDYDGSLPGLQTYTCALDANAKKASGPLVRYVKSSTIVRCPCDRSGAKDRGRFSYAVNGYMTMLVGPGSSADPKVADLRGAPMSKSRQSSRTILFVEENTDPTRTDFPASDAVFIYFDRCGDRHGVSPPREFSTKLGKIYSRGIANVCYLDGHLGAAPGMIEWSSPEGQEIFFK